MLDEEIFKERLSQQCKNLPIYILAGWKLAENVFLSSAKYKDDKFPTFIFYYDKNEIKRRPLSAMNEHAQKVFSLSGAATATVSDDENDNVYIFYFFHESSSFNPIENEEIALCLSAEIFIQNNGCQVRWYDKPFPVELNLLKLCN